jgi:hypothetical protein
MILLNNVLFTAALSVVITVVSLSGILVIIFLTCFFGDTTNACLDRDLDYAKIGFGLTLF